MRSAWSDSMVSSHPRHRRRTMACSMCTNTYKQIVASIYLHICMYIYNIYIHICIYTHISSLRPIDPYIALIAVALKNVQLYVRSSMEGRVARACDKTVSLPCMRTCETCATRQSSRNEPDQTGKEDSVS